MGGTVGSGHISLASTEHTHTHTPSEFNDFMQFRLINLEQLNFHSDAIK